MIYAISLYLMATLYVLAGVWHFVKPKIYLKIMPPYLPAHLFLVYLSGVLEVLFGAMLYFPETRTYGAWGIIALLIGVFPANIYMLQKGGAAFQMPKWVLIVRLPVQALLIFWAWLYT
jgi:uncharacterized membrane protein